MDQDDHFKELIRAIIIEELPDEDLAFDLSFDPLLRRLDAEGYIGVQEKKSNINFVETTAEVISFIALLTSTFKTVMDVKRDIRKDKRDILLLQNDWKENLVRSGVSKNMAEKISEKHLKALQEYLKK